MKEKLEKMLDYLELLNQSKAKEKAIINSVFYKMFGRYNQQREELVFQVAVTKRIENRLETLKKEL